MIIAMHCYSYWLDCIAAHKVIHVPSDEPAKSCCKLRFTSATPYICFIYHCIVLHNNFQLPTNQGTNIDHICLHLFAFGDIQRHPDVCLLLFVQSESFDPTADRSSNSWILSAALWLTGTWSLGRAPSLPEYTKPCCETCQRILGFDHRITMWYFQFKRSVSNSDHFYRVSICVIICYILIDQAIYNIYIHLQAKYIKIPHTCCFIDCYSM